MNTLDFANVDKHQNISVLLDCNCQSSHLEPSPPYNICCSEVLLYQNNCIYTVSHWLSVSGSVTQNLGQPTSVPTAHFSASPERDLTLQQVLGTQEPSLHWWCELRASKLPVQKNAVTSKEQMLMLECCTIVRDWVLSRFTPSKLSPVSVCSLCSPSLVVSQAGQALLPPSFETQIPSPYYLPGNCHPTCSRQAAGCSGRRMFSGDASVGRTSVILGWWLQCPSVCSVSLAFLVCARWNATHCIQDIMKEEFYDWAKAYFSACLFVSHVLAVTHWICWFVCN